MSIVALCLLLLGGTRVAYAQTTAIDIHQRFLERIATAAESGSIEGKPVATYLHEEQVLLLQGSLGDIKRLCQDTLDTAVTMNVTLCDEKRYKTGFFRGEECLAAIAYPADYNLILGIKMEEAESALVENVRHATIPSIPTQTVDASMLLPTADSSVYLLPGDYFILPTLSAKRYYAYDDSCNMVPVFNSSYPVESMANLMTGIDVEHGIDLDVKMIKYGFQTERFVVPLRGWIAYCMNEGCKPYFGVISQADDSVVCEVVMNNEALGYAHVMKVTFNPAIIADGKGVVTARLNGYIPFSKVKSLFYEYEKHH